MIGVCEKCGKENKLDRHHKDGNHGNDVPENRVAVCSSCHRLAHSKLGIGTNKRDSYLPVDWKPAPIPFEEVRRQYIACFPRV